MTIVPDFCFKTIGRVREIRHEISDFGLNASSQNYSLKIFQHQIQNCISCFYINWMLVMIRFHSFIHSLTQCLINKRNGNFSWCLCQQFCLCILQGFSVCFASSASSPAFVAKKWIKEIIIFNMIKNSLKYQTQCIFMYQCVICITTYLYNYHHYFLISWILSNSNSID